jgi:hypothetical protein
MRITATAKTAARRKAPGAPPSAIPPQMMLELRRALDAAVEQYQTSHTQLQIKDLHRRKVRPQTALSAIARTLTKSDDWRRKNRHRTDPVRPILEALRARLVVPRVPAIIPAPRIPVLAERFVSELRKRRMVKGKDAAIRAAIVGLLEQEAALTLAPGRVLPDFFKAGDDAEAIANARRLRDRLLRSRGPFGGRTERN